MDEQWMPGNKKELLSAIEREWKQLLQLAENLTDEQMLTPDAGGWSPKDNLAHVTEWMKILMDYYMDKRPAYEVLNVSPEVTRDWDMEVINPILFERNRNRSRQDVMDGLKQVYRQLLDRLEAMSFDDLLKPCFEDEPEKRPLLMSVLDNTTDHFLEHRVTIARSLQGSQT